MNNRIIVASFPAAFRIILVLLIIAAFGLAISGGTGLKNSKVLGSSSNRSVETIVGRETVNAEIKKTQAVLTARPDYVAAWMRLSVLYEQIGESEMANSARETAKNLTRF